MKNIKYKIVVWAFLAGAFLAGSCEKEIAEPEVGFEIFLNNKPISVNNIPAGKQIVFKNTGKAQYISIWTGDEMSVYTGVTEELITKEKKLLYTFADGRKDSVAIISVNSPVNSGKVVDVKSGSFAYTYPDVAISDTTYQVVWIATNVDIKGNTKTEIKKVTVTVKKN